VSDDQVTTESGIPVPPFCDGPGSDAIGAPGEYPYTRGVRADGYRSRPWTMRQYAGFASAEETNERFHLLLERGQTGLSTAFDLPTQLGLVSDDPKSLG
jgi:methylmalonyl-CoA mutase N-terminal domain/subunit